MNTKDSRLIAGPTAPPALRPSTTKLPNTSTRMWPAIIATNSRSPRLNGRTMNEISSTRKMSGSSSRGVPGGENKGKNRQPGRPVRDKQGEEAEAVLPEAGDQHDREADDRHQAGDGELARHGERLRA